MGAKGGAKEHADWLRGFFGATLPLRLCNRKHYLCVRLSNEKKLVLQPNKYG